MTRPEATPRLTPALSPELIVPMDIWFKDGMPSHRTVSAVVAGFVVAPVDMFGIRDRDGTDRRRRQADVGETEVHPSGHGILKHLSSFSAEMDLLGVYLYVAFRNMHGILRVHRQGAVDDHPC